MRTETVILHNNDDVELLFCREGGVFRITQDNHIISFSLEDVDEEEVEELINGIRQFNRTEE